MTTFAEIDKYELLVFGYINSYQQTQSLSSIVPKDIFHVVLRFYPTSVVSYGIGGNVDNVFGFLHGRRQGVKQYTELIQLNKICNDPEFFYISQHCMIVQNATTKQLYVSGHKYQINSNYINKIASFEKLSDVIAGGNDTLKKRLFHNNNEDYIKCISDGIFSAHSILVSNKGEFYEFGKELDRVSPNKPKLNDIDMKSVFSSTKVIKISCPEDASLFLCENGIYGCGCNGSGRIGFGDISSVPIPTRIKLTDHNNINDGKIVDISCGSKYSLCVTKNGNLYVFGWNYYGQLCTSTTEPYNTPKLNYLYNHNQKINIKSVNCGAWHSLVIDNNNICYLFGINTTANIGIGFTSQAVTTPEEFKIAPIKHGQCGYRHTILLTTVGEVYGFGQNSGCEISSKLPKTHVVQPYHVTKKEIGIPNDNQITRVIALPYSTIIIAE